MLSFSRIKGFLRRIGIRDGGSNTTNSNGPVAGTGSKQVSASTTSTTAGGSSAAVGGIEGCSLLAGLPPNAGSQAILQHIEKFVNAHSIGCVERIDEQEDAVFSAGAGGESEGKMNSDDTSAPIAMTARPAEHSTASTSPNSEETGTAADQDGGESSLMSTGHSTSAAPMDPAVFRNLLGFSEFTPGTTPSHTPTRRGKPTTTEKGQSGPLLPPPLFGAAYRESRRQSRADLWNEGHYYHKFRAAHPKAPSASACLTGTTAPVTSASSPVSLGSGATAGSPSSGTAGKPETSVLMLLLRERSDVLDALDICMQEVPANTTTNTTMPKQAGSKLRGDGTPVSSRTTSAAASLQDCAPSTESSVRTTATAVPATQSGEKVFGVFEWRVLLLRIVELLIDIDQSIYVERHMGALAFLNAAAAGATSLAGQSSARQSISDSSAAVAPATTTSTVTTSVESLTQQRKSATSVSKGDSKASTEGIPAQMVEDMLATECAIATWLVLRDILEQQIALLKADLRRQSESLARAEDAEDDEAGHDSQSTPVHAVSSSVSPSAKTEASTPAAAGAITTASTPSKPDSSNESNTNNNSNAVAARKTVMAILGASAHSDDEEALHKLLHDAYVTQRVVVEWHRVVRDLEHVMCFEEPNVAECVVCASFLHDDNRELMLTMIQHPLPRALFDRVSTQKKKDVTKTANASSPPSATPSAAAEGSSHATPGMSAQLPNTHATAAAATPASAPVTSSSSSSSTTAEPTTTGTTTTTTTPGTTTATATARLHSPSASADASGSLFADVDVTMDDLVAVSAHVYATTILHPWRKYLEEKAVLAGVATRGNVSRAGDGPAAASQSSTLTQSNFSSRLPSRRQSSALTERESLVLPVPILTSSHMSMQVDDEESATLRAPASRLRREREEDDTAVRTREVSVSLDRSPQQPMLTARPSEVRCTGVAATELSEHSPNTSSSATTATTMTATTTTATAAETAEAALGRSSSNIAAASTPLSLAAYCTKPVNRASPASSTNSKNPLFGDDDSPTTQLMTPLDPEDPFVFCRVATAFAFSAGDLSDDDREMVFRFLCEGMGPRLVSKAAANHSATNSRGRMRRGTLFPHNASSASAASSNPQPITTLATAPAPSSISVTPIADVLTPAPGTSEAPLFVAATDVMYDWVAAKMEANRQHRPYATSSQGVSPTRPDSQRAAPDDGEDAVRGMAAQGANLVPYARLHAAVFERVMLIAWAAALHKEVEMCLRGRPHRFDAACELAQEENAVAALCHHFHSRQVALSSLVRANLAVGKTHEALAAARKHFKREKRAWTSHAQTIFTAIGYLESMVQLVQAQAACSAYGGVIETGQFVLQQTVLCSQMLATVAPKPKQSFVLRYGSCHAKLLHARCFLLHEVWCAHASFNDIDKTERYFNEYINSLSWIQKRVRDKSLFEAYMERGSQLLKKKQYAKALEQFTAAVDVAKRCVSENEAAMKTKASSQNKSGVPTSSANKKTDSVASSESSATNAASASASAAAAAGQGSFVPALNLPRAGSDAYVFVPRATTATGGCADDTAAAQPHATARDAEEAADLERTLDLQWHLAESERMMSLSLVAMAENEVNVPARRTELSHAVNSAYASQSSLQKWQTKGGSPKRLLTGGPSNLIVMCRALLLLSQPRKAAMLLEPLVEDKSSFASARPPKWRDILSLNDEALTAEDIALRVYVNSVRITVYTLYMQCLSRFDGERALRVAQHVTTLLEESEAWVQTVRGRIREKQVAVQQTRISRSASVFYGNTSGEASPASRATTMVPGMQSHFGYGQSDGGTSSQTSIAAERTPVTSDLVETPLAGSKFVSASPDAEGVGDVAVVENAGEGQHAPGQRLTILTGSAAPLTRCSSQATAPPPPETPSQTAPAVGGNGVTGAVGVTPMSTASASELAGHGLSVCLESRSERVTALRALSQASLDITTGYRELSVTYGDAYCLLERWEDALTAYSHAMVLCQMEEDMALASTAMPTGASSAAGGPGSTSSAAVVAAGAAGRAAGGTLGVSASATAAVPPRTNPQLLAGDTLDEMFLLDNEIDGGIMDIETMDPKMARNLREMLVHGTRVDYHVNANAVNAKLARVHTALGKFSTAMDYHELVLDFAVSTDDKLLQYKSLLALARLYTHTHATTKAQTTWEHVSALAREYEDTTVGRETLRNMIAANEAAGMYYDVITNAEQLNSLSSNVEGSEATADRRFALEALAHAHLELAQYKECHAALDEREKVQEKAMEWSGRLMSLRAQAFVGQGDIAEAIKVLVRYVNKARQLNNWSELGRANAGLAKAYASGDNLFKARRSYMAALRAFALQGPLKSEERDVVLQASRWLVHYYYLSDEEVQVNAGAVYEPDTSRRGASNAGFNNNASNIEDMDETLEGRTTFEHDLHNNSGDLSQLLEEDESKRRTLNDMDFDDEFGVVDDSWDDDNDDDADNFLTGQSFSGANMAALLSSGDTVSVADADGSYDHKNNSNNNNNSNHELLAPKEDNSNIGGAAEAETDSNGESAASADTGSQSSGSSPGTRSSATTPTADGASTAPPASTSRASTTTTTTTTTSGVTRNPLQPAPTSIAHVSFCSRPALPVNGSDALDGSAGGRGRSSSSTSRSDDADGESAPFSIGAASPPNALLSTRAPAESASKDGVAKDSGHDAASTTTTSGVNRSSTDGTGGVPGEGSSTTAPASLVVTAVQREKRTRPSKTITLHYRSALETMEWTTRLLLNGDRVMPYRPAILYSPAEAVDLALLTHPRTTFVFYFAEYTMDSSSCYDVVVRPAHTNKFFRRSAQLTTLRAYQSTTTLDDIRNNREAQSRAKMASAAFGAEHSKVSVASEVGPGSPRAPTSASQPAASSTDDAEVITHLLHLDTQKRLYDLYEELWSGVEAGLRRAQSSLAEAESVFVVPEATLLHVPFHALMPNPEMTMPGELIAPVGEQSTLTVVPSLLHLVQHDVNRSAVYARRLSVPPLLSSAKDRKPVFFPENFHPHPRAAAAHTSTEVSARLEGSAGGLHGATLAPHRGSVASDASSSVVHSASPPGGVSTAAPPPSTSVPTQTTPAYAASATNSASQRSAFPDNEEVETGSGGDSDVDELLRARWAVRYGCTRKELVHAFTDTTTRAIMVLCDAKDHALLVADGTVDFKDISQPIVAGVDALYEAAAATANGLGTSTTSLFAATNPVRRMVASGSSASFLSSPQEAMLLSGTRMPLSASTGALYGSTRGGGAGTGSASANTNVASPGAAAGAGVGGAAHGLLLSPSLAPAGAPVMSVANALALSHSLPVNGPNAASTTLTGGSTATAATSSAGAAAPPPARLMLPENVCGNLELVVLSCDRSATTSSGEPGLAARLCLQLGCVRVLRVDLVRGQTFSDAHRRFINTYLGFLEKAQKWNLDGAYAVALRSAIANARAAQVPSTIWSAFTLVGAP